MFELNREALAKMSRGERARWRLLEAAVEEFGLNSLEGARTREIVERAGQNVASINYYFGGKKALYLEIAQRMADYMRERLGPFLEECEGFFEEEKGRPQDRRRALDLIKKLHLGLIRSILAEERTLAMSMILLREQAHPTEAFDIIYDGFIARMHGMVSRLAAYLRGLEAESREAKVLAHATLGQVFGYRAAREGILRRIGVKSFDDEMVKLIEDTVMENLERVYWVRENRK